MKRTALFLCSFVLIYAFIGGCASQAAAVNEYDFEFVWPDDSGNTSKAVWPGTAWPKSAPEEQGVDSAKLRLALLYMGFRERGIVSMVIIRNGYNIAEYHMEPFAEDTQLRINSCTKSFTATLVGIAIDRQIINSTDDKITKFFPEARNTNPQAEDNTFESITIGDLLTMRSGIKWINAPESINEVNDEFGFQATTDWLEYVFSKPVVKKPGTVFNYNSMNSQILMDIIHRKTGGHSDTFAMDNLLDPLGITSAAWGKSPEGSLIGGTFLQMKTSDLARLGYLYLHKGMWNGKRIVSEEWVRKSITPYSKAEFGGELTGEYYGYQWWIPNEKSFMAMGGNGQICYVYPEKNLVIALQCGAIDAEEFVTRTVFARIANSILSDEALPENNGDYQELVTLLEKTGEASADGVYTDVDLLKKKLDNRKIVFEQNNFGFQELHFHFNDDDTLTSEERFGYGWASMSRKTALSGLDGRYLSYPDTITVWPVMGENRSSVFSRVKSIQKNFISIERLYNGTSKGWYSYDILITGNTVECRVKIKKYGLYHAANFTINGQIE